MKVIFPWPPGELSPNARVHWARKAKAAKKYKSDCAWTLIEHKVGKQTGDSVNLSLSYFPPDKRRRDLDNLLSSSKQMIDAIAEAIGIDDSRFHISLARCQPTKNGEIVVEIASMADRTETAKNGY